MSKLRVLLCGEGQNELGSRFGHRAYQSDDRPGVLPALLRRVEQDGWEVAEGLEWKRIRKFRVGKAEHADTANVLGAVLRAKESGYDLLVFSRDRDNDAERAEAIESAMDRAQAVIADAPPIIGGVAVPTLEGWILALIGVRRTEEMSPTRAAEALSETGVAAKDTDAMVSAVESADLAKIPPDAVSLRQWLSRADALPRLVRARSA